MMSLALSSSPVQCSTFSSTCQRVKTTLSEMKDKIPTTYSFERDLTEERTGFIPDSRAFFHKALQHRMIFVRMGVEISTSLHAVFYSTVVIAKAGKS